VASLRIVAGNAQVSDAGSELPLPLVARLTDAAGVPIAGERVTWTITDGGELDPAESLTNDSGYVRTRWTLGAQTGAHVLEATAGSAVGARFGATAAVPLPLGVIQPIGVTTFDGSGEVVHPDVARVPRRWASGQRYLAITPYPNGNSKLEMPSVFVAGDASAWALPPDGLNPIARPTNGYLSDPDVVFEPSRRELWLYYREVGVDNAIFLTQSANGTRWSTPVAVARAPNHELISPSVVRVSATEWHMWTVNGGELGCSGSSTTVEHRTSSDGVTWSDPARASMGGRDTPWHIDVTWIPELRQYWALFNAKTAGTCATPALYLAMSTDAVTWKTYPTPVLERGVTPQFKDIVYRSTLEYDAASDIVTFWYSGAAYRSGGRWEWSAAVQRRRREDLFASINQAAMQIRQRPESVPPLLDAP
jgi:hypothetical protein